MAARACGRDATRPCALVVYHGRWRTRDSGPAKVSLCRKAYHPVATFDTCCSLAMLVTQMRATATPSTWCCRTACHASAASRSCCSMATMQQVGRGAQTGGSLASRLRENVRNHTRHMGAAVITSGRWGNGAVCRGVARLGATCRCVPPCRRAGPLPDAWTQLNQLQELWVTDNILTGSLPASYSALTGLTTLKLHVSAPVVLSRERGGHARGCCNAPVRRLG